MPSRPVRSGIRRSWVVVVLLFAATTISYIDRQALSVVAPVLRDDLGISNFEYARIVFAFLLAYTIMQPCSGWIVDRLGAGPGFALLMLWWSGAAMLHALGAGVMSLSAFRFLLGVGQAGSWAASVRAVAESVPLQRRGLANGVWGAGTSAGSIVAVPVVAWLTLAFGWRAAFLATGSLGLLWTAVWLAVYRRPTRDAANGLLPEIDGSPPRPRESYRSLFGLRQTWALVLARMCMDPIAWFYNAWVPEYLARSGGLSLADIGRFGWIPFVANGAGIVLGGVLSDRLFRRTRRLIGARLAVMGAGAVLMLAGVAAAFPIHIAVSVGSISVAMFGFGLWAPNMMSLGADMFPSHLVGSITGLSGVGAGVGGMTYTLFTGWMLDRYGYGPVFVASGLMPLVAFGVLRAVMGRTPVRAATV